MNSDDEKASLVAFALGTKCYGIGIICIEKQELAISRCGSRD